MAIVKFLYSSQFVLDTEPTAGSTNPVTSEGILKALDNISTSKLSLVQSGYMIDNISDKERPFDISDKDGKITLGSQSREQVLWRPNGLLHDKPTFEKRVIPEGTIIDTLEEVDAGGAINCEVFICYDFLAEKLVAIPDRTEVPKSTKVIQWMYAQPQDKNGEGPKIGSTSFDAVWWDYTANKMKQFAGEWSDAGVEISLPLAKGLRVNGTTSSILYDFSMTGYCGKIAWVIPGASYIFTNGRKESNGLINVSLGTIEEVISKVILDDNSQPFQDYYLFVSSDGELIGPDNDYTFNYHTGVYENKLGEEKSLCRIAFISGGYVNPRNDKEPVTVNSFAPFDVVTIATTDDIEDVMRLIINQIQYELGIVHAELDEAVQDIAELDKTVTDEGNKFREASIVARQTELNSVRKRFYNLRGDLVDSNALNTVGKNKENDVVYVLSNGSYYVYLIDALGKGYFEQMTSIKGELNTKSDLDKIFTSTLGDAYFIKDEGVFYRYDGKVYKKLNKVKGNLKDTNGIQAMLTPKENDAYYLPSTRSYYVYKNGKFQVVADDSKYEVIEGVKEFKQGIIGSLDGVAKYVKKIYDTAGSQIGEIMPMGVQIKANTPIEKYTDKEDIHVVSTVRIGGNYVKATNFIGTATKAKYADIAEIYKADKKYEAGTLIMFGGTEEVTVANMGIVNGVVSTNPAYLMNHEEDGIPIALAGRLPIRIIGKVNKFDNITLDEMAPGVGRVAKAGEPVIAKALVSDDFIGEKLVECVTRFTL